jgi:16S rRNA processing protein RimM
MPNERKSGGNGGNRRPKPKPGNRQSSGTSANDNRRRPPRRFDNQDRVASATPRERPAQLEPKKPEPEVLEMPTFEQPEYLLIAEIAAPFGLRGGVKANVLTDFPERFELMNEVYLAPPGAPPNAPREKRKLLNARQQNAKQMMLRFEGVTKIEQAELLRGYTIAVPITEAMPLPEGEYYVYQIVGLDVYTTDEQFVGKVVNVERFPANDVYSVRGPMSKKDVLLPAIKDVVKNIDLDKNRMTIELLEGLI